MADKSGYRPEECGAPLKYKDLGDGTFAQAVSTEGSSGAPYFANGQITAGAASGQLVPARETRRSVLIRNLDSSNSAYIGRATVTSSNGMLLKAGESVSVDTTAAINCIRATSDVVLAYLETYD